MSDDRRRYLLLISRKLVILAGTSLLVSSAIFAVPLIWADRMMISWLVFMCGLIGGFVSIQQRLPKIRSEELQLLSESWTKILLIPVYGGIFALVLYVLFLSGLLEGHLFPQFAINQFSNPPTTENIHTFLLTYPSSGPDFAKLIFWSFVAGFSERFVPQIIQKLSTQADEGDKG